MISGSALDLCHRAIAFVHCWLAGYLKICKHISIEVCWQSVLDEMIVCLFSFPSVNSVPSQALKRFLAQFSSFTLTLKPSHCVRCNSKTNGELSNPNGMLVGTIHLNEHFGYLVAL